MSKLPDEAFRDTIGTIDKEGNRKFIFPKKPSGKFYDYRKWVSYVLLIILVANPFVKINGNQFMMFNVLERRFNIFGFPFWPQDFLPFCNFNDCWRCFRHSFYSNFWSDILRMDLSSNYISGNGF